MPDEPTERDDEQGEPSPFQRFENFARKLVAVPKREIDEQEVKVRKGRTPA
jgi:hypothetical protein